MQVDHFRKFLAFIIFCYSSQRMNLNQLCIIALNKVADLIFCLHTWRRIRKYGEACKSASRCRF